MFNKKPLSEKELRRLAKLEHTLQRGWMRFTLAGFLKGALGGLLFALAMLWLRPSKPPEALQTQSVPQQQSRVLSHSRVAIDNNSNPAPALQRVNDGIDRYLGPRGKFMAISIVLFSLAFGTLSAITLWRGLRRHYRFQRERAEMHGQYPARHGGGS